MPTAIATQTVNAPVSVVWALFDDFAAIHKNHPDIKDSYTIGGTANTGLGAQRQCDFKDGKNYVREEIVSYVPEERLDIDIYDGTFPLRQALAKFRFEAVSTAQSKVTMTMDFTPKFGAVGALMGPMMRAQFQKAMDRLLKEHAKAAEDRARMGVAA